MNTYTAIMLFPADNGQARFQFDANEDFLNDPPARVFDSFFNTVEGLNFPADVKECDINTAYHDATSQSATASGIAKLNNGSTLPFVAVIYQS